MRTRAPEARRRATGAWLLLATCAALLAPGAARAQRPMPGSDLPPGTEAEASDRGSILQAVGFDQNLDAQLPLDLELRDERGRAVRLGAYFGERPVVLAMVYYRCPMLCSQVLNGLVRSLRPLSLEVGEDFDVVAVSIDPLDTPQMAGKKKAAYVEEYGRPETAGGWHFLTGPDEAVRRLAGTVGFRYSFDPETRLYAHAAGVVVVTPSGRVSRYLFGIDYPPRDLQFAVLESSEGKVGAPVRRVLLFCYDYDAASGKYTLSIVRVTQVFGVLTALTLAGAVLLMLRWERRRGRQLAPGATAPAAAVSETS